MTLVGYVQTLIDAASVNDWDVKKERGRERKEIRRRRRRGGVEHGSLNRRELAEAIQSSIEEAFRYHSLSTRHHCDCRAIVFFLDAENNEVEAFRQKRGDEAENSRWAEDQERGDGSRRLARERKEISANALMSHVSVSGIVGKCVRERKTIRVSNVMKHSMYSERVDGFGLGSQRLHIQHRERDQTKESSGVTKERGTEGEKRERKQDAVESREDREGVYVPLLLPTPLSPAPFSPPSSTKRTHQRRVVGVLQVTWRKRGAKIEEEGKDTRELSPKGRAKRTRGLSLLLSLFRSPSHVSILDLLSSALAERLATCSLLEQGSREVIHLTSEVEKKQTKIQETVFVAKTARDIMECSRRLHETRSLDDVIDCVKGIGWDLFRVQHAALFVVDWETRRLVSFDHNSDERLEVPVSEGILGRVARCGKPCLLRKREYRGESKGGEAEEEWEEEDLLRGHWARDMLCVPVFDVSKDLRSRDVQHGRDSTEEGEVGSESDGHESDSDSNSESKRESESVGNLIERLGVGFDGDAMNEYVEREEENIQRRAREQRERDGSGRRKRKRHRRKVVGVIQFANRNDKPLSHRDLELALSLSAHVAISMVVVDHLESLEEELAKKAREIVLQSKRIARLGEMERRLEKYLKLCHLLVSGRGNAFSGETRGERGNKRELVERGASFSYPRFLAHISRVVSRYLPGVIGCEGAVLFVIDREESKLCSLQAVIEKALRRSSRLRHGKGEQRRGKRVCERGCIYDSKGGSVSFASVITNYPSPFLHILS